VVTPKARQKAHDTCNRSSGTTFRNNRQKTDRNSGSESVKTSRFYRVFEWILDSIVDHQPKLRTAVEQRLQLLPNLGVLLYDAGCSFALPASKAAMQRRGHGRCPAGHEPSSSAVLHRWAPPCGGPEVLYTLIERLVGEYLALLEGRTCAVLGANESRWCRCAQSPRRVTSDKAAAVANASEIAIALGGACRSGALWRRAGVSPKRLGAGAAP
jgi:hypothetical protein